MDEEPSIGTVLGSWIDDEDHLRIVAKTHDGVFLQGIAEPCQDPQQHFEAICASVPPCRSPMAVARGGTWDAEDRCNTIITACARVGLPVCQALDATMDPETGMMCGVTMRAHLLTPQENHEIHVNAMFGMGDWDPPNDGGTILIRRDTKAYTTWLLRFWDNEVLPPWRATAEGVRVPMHEARKVREMLLNGK